MQTKIVSAEHRMKEIAILQTHITNYLKTKEVMPAIANQAILRSIMRNTPTILNSARNRKRHLTSFCHRTIPVKQLAHTK